MKLKSTLLILASTLNVFAMRGTLFAQTIDINRVSPENTTSCNVKGGGTNVPTSTYTNPNAIQVCGKFKVYYEDIQLGDGLWLQRSSAI